MKITMQPTGDFAMYVGIATRVWNGMRGDGSEVAVLVAAVSGRNDAGPSIIGLTPIPPPSSAWTPGLRYRMTRIWQLGDRLTEREVHVLAQLAEGWVADRQPWGLR